MLEERWVAADDPVLLPLIADLARDYDARYPPTDGVPSSAELTRYPAEVFAAEHGGAFVAVFNDGMLVAGGALKRGVHGAGEVKRMWTAEAHRRRGLARRVLGLLERRAAELGYRELELTTGALQPEAIAFYVAAGWAPHFDPAVTQAPAAYLRFTKAAPPPAG